MDSPLFVQRKNLSYKILNTEVKVMKLIEIKCPSCGGKLTVENSQSQLYTCEFCGNQFFIDKETHQTVTNNYTIYTTDKKNNQGNLVWRTAGGIMVSGLLLLTILFTKAAGSNSYGPSYQPNRPAANTDFTNLPNKTNTDTDSSISQWTTKIFGKPVSEITKEERSGIKYLKVSTSIQWCTISYSFDDPYTATSPVIKTIKIPRDDWKDDDIFQFGGVTKLDMGHSLNWGMNLKKLPELRGIMVSGLDFAQLSAMVSDPGLIKEIRTKDVPSIDGVDAFENLEVLELNDVEQCDLKLLVGLKNLKSLSIEKVNQTDFSPISVMESLETLYLDAEDLRDISFLSGLPSLSSLTLKNSSVLTIAPLAGKSSLTTLVLESNGTLTDFQPVGSLTGLVDLKIDKYTAQPDPDLSALNQLEKLDISGFMSLSSLKNMTGLKELSIHGCNVDDANVLSALSNVETLTLYSVWTSKSQPDNLDFIKGMTNLTCAHFTGPSDTGSLILIPKKLDVYGDISSVLNHQNLEELHLDYGQFEINFDRIKDNPSLRVLSLKNLSLKKNFYVQSSGFANSIWYDDVTLSEHMDFLYHFPNLEELDLSSNSLTDVSFASKLANLKVLNLEDNYITDLSPLIQVESLEYLNVKDNPVKTTDGITDGIMDTDERTKE